MIAVVKKPGISDRRETALIRITGQRQFVGERKFGQMIYLETERLILRDYREDDLDAYCQLMTDSKTMYYLQDIQLHTKEEAYEDFHRILEDMSKSDRRFYFMHIESKDSHEQIGSVGYTVTDDTPVGKIVGAGYFIYPKFWGKGYTTEAFRRVLAYAFSDNNVYRVTTGCLAENIGSERVMQKCGLIREAEHIDYEWHDGKMKTRLEYRLLKREWDYISQGESLKGGHFQTTDCYACHSMQGGIK